MLTLSARLHMYMYVHASKHVHIYIHTSADGAMGYAIGLHRAV